MADAIKELEPIDAAKAEAKDYRMRLRKARALLAAAEKERDELKARVPAKGDAAKGDTAPDPALQAERDALVKERDELRGKVRERAHADAFRALQDDADFAGDSVWKKMPTAKLWALAGYAPEDDEPDPAALKDLLVGLKESDPYLFTPAAAGGGQATSQEVKSPRPPGPGASRGAPAGDSGKMVVSLADTLSPDWQSKHGAEFTKALGAGNVRYVD